MTVTRLRLENFRNFADETFELTDGINILAGHNAQGKTNCIEAIYFCSCLKSYRVLKEEQLIRFGAENAAITLTFSVEGREEELKILFAKGKPKEFRYNGLVVSRLRDLLGCFQSVIFTPDHLNLIKEGPHKRRNFLDMALCSIDLRYTDQLLNYQKIIKNRNALLRQCQTDYSLSEMLEIWDEKLAEAGAYIAEARQKYITSLSEYAKEYYSEISQKQEKLKLIYLNQFTKDAVTREEYAALFKERLRRMRETDIAMGQTVSGIHKDDILILLSGKSMKFFASQGQIRSAVLAMKLAEAECISRLQGSEPVLLLDDILSELDAHRQKFIFQKMDGRQTVLTTCELGKIRKKGDKVFTIKDGKVAKVRVPASGSGCVDQKK
ncbi:MAG: DNA replication/repair protein RecF [Clostridia bacterium]|nr:DNA replication/repair protein RecF [Clostridia bacterium]